jgi:hypothetical protein
MISQIINRAVMKEDPSLPGWYQDRSTVIETGREASTTDRAMNVFLPGERLDEKELTIELSSLASQGNVAQIIVEERGKGREAPSLIQRSVAVSLQKGPGGFYAQVGPRGNAETFWVYLGQDRVKASRVFSEIAHPDFRIEGASRVERVGNLYSAIAFYTLTVPGDGTANYTPGFLRADSEDANIKILKEIASLKSSIAATAVALNNRSVPFNEIPEYQRDLRLDEARLQSLRAQLADKAQLLTPGGIDMNAGNMTMNEAGNRAQMNFDPQVIEDLKTGDFSGVRPVILNVTPFTNINSFLGSAPA